MKNFGSRHRSSQGVLANRTVATIAVITAASIAKSIAISTGHRRNRVGIVSFVGFGAWLD